MEFSDYMAIFLDEGREALQRLNELLLCLEKTPDDVELLNDIFRVAHTFKGMASTMGFEGVAQLAHGMENLLDALRNRTILPDAALADVLLRSVDALEHKVEDIAAGRGDAFAPEALLAELAARSETAQAGPGLAARVEAAPAPEAELEQVVAGPARLYHVDITLDAACMMKSVRALMITSSLETQAEVLSISPSLEELEWSEDNDRFQVLLKTAAPPQALEATLRAVGEVASVRLTELPQEPVGAPAPAPIVLDEHQRVVLEHALSEGFVALRLEVVLMPNSAMKSVRASMVLSALDEFGTVLRADPDTEALENEHFDDRFSLIFLTTSEAAEVKSSVLNIAEVQTVNLEPVDPSQLPAAVGAELTLKVPAAERPSFRPADSGHAAPRRRQTVRVGTDRIDALMGLVGELMAERTQLLDLARQHPRPELEAIARRFDHVATQLHHEMLRLRLVPVETVFNRFPRMVRDLSRELGKEVEFVLAGQHTELDRLIVDELGDPLVHLLRNALDHGLETPAERLANGKPAQGCLRLSAHQEGTHVVVTVSDDGRGLDAGKILAKAREKGLLKGGGVITDQRLLELICMPGFSTASATTSISGRGVGMDVVKSKINALGGSIDIETEPGVGTSYKIHLPLSKTLMQAMLADVGGEVYGIPAGQVEAIVPLDAENALAVGAGELALPDGERVPTVNLRERFEVPGDASGLEGGTALIVRTATQRVALLVESVLGLQEISLKPMSRLMGDLRFLAGAATLGDGRVALIVDPAQLV